MLFGKYPFDKATKKDPKYNLIIMHESEQYWKLFDDLNLSEEVKDLVVKMLDPTPKRRPTLE